MASIGNHEYPSVDVSIRRVGCALEPDHVRDALRELAEKHGVHEATMRQQLERDVFYRHISSLRNWRNLTVDRGGVRETLVLAIEGTDRTEALHLHVTVRGLRGSCHNRLFDLLRETVHLWK